MDAASAVGLAYYLGLGIACLGVGLGLGRAIGSAMEAMGRQPEAIPKIQIAMIIGAAFIEALAIYALISIFLGPKAEVPEPAAVEAAAVVVVE